jgi:hypothetical protein
MNELTLRLHSKYQPQAEADRYIEALGLPLSIDCFILIEPGLGYLITALQKHRPGRQIVVLRADERFRELGGSFPNVPQHYPGSKEGVQEFLEAQIPDSASIKIIEWRPSVSAYGDAAVCLVRESTAFINRQMAGRRTEAAYGARWVRNFFKNLTLINNTLLYKQMDIPVVITGSGPSLEAALPQICANRAGIFLLAASSSLGALASSGLYPDMAISTDGGGWALLHLSSLFRFRATTKAPSNGPTILAFGLCAAIPSQCAALPLLPVSDGSLWQNMALNAAGIPSALVPQCGTVTASAVELALLLSTSSIILAGMDLQTCDIRSHARPYGFDHLFSGAASRLSPLYSQYFIRSGDIKAGGSYDVYAAWFKNRIAAWPKRVFSLAGNHAAFNSIINKKPFAKNAAAFKAQDYFSDFKAEGLGRPAAQLAAETLIAALAHPEYSQGITAELGPLLFPGKKNATAGGIAQALQEIVSRYN